MGNSPETEEKKSGDNEYKVLIYQCIRCYGYSDYVIDDTCCWCRVHPWTWDMTLEKKKKKRMVTASW